MGRLEYYASFYIFERRWRKLGIYDYKTRRELIDKVVARAKARAEAETHDSRVLRIPPKYLVQYAIELGCPHFAWLHPSRDEIIAITINTGML